MRGAISAPWTAAYSVSGTFDGLVTDTPYTLALPVGDRVRDLILATAEASPAGDPAVEPFEGWDAYCVPILDQRQTGMCQSFSSMIRLSTLLRCKLSPYFLAGEIETMSDDLCLDPRHGHRMGRAKYAPGEPYDRAQGLPAGCTIDVLREAGLLSPGTRNDPIPWRDVPAWMAVGLPELPLLVTDAYDPARMSDKGEIGRAMDPLAIRGAHSMGGVGTARGKDGRWYIKLANSWHPWGIHGYAWISLALAEWSAIDRPRLLTISDPTWYAEHDEWRALLCLKTELDRWLLAA